MIIKFYLKVSINCKYKKIEIIDNDLSICEGEECYLLFILQQNGVVLVRRIKPLLKKIPGMEPTHLS